MPHSHPSPAPLRLETPGYNQHPTMVVDLKWEVFSFLYYWRDKARLIGNLASLFPIKAPTFPPAQSTALPWPPEGPSCHLWWPQAWTPLTALHASHPWLPAQPVYGLCIWIFRLLCNKYRHFLCLCSCTWTSISRFWPSVPWQVTVYEVVTTGHLRNALLMLRSIHYVLKHGIVAWKYLV